MEIEKEMKMKIEMKIEIEKKDGDWEGDEDRGEVESDKNIWIRGEWIKHSFAKGIATSNINGMVWP